MRLRPVNAIFYEPKSKFIVIYQNGQLWQLPRMKVDIHSWQNRNAYTGSKNSLYLSREQKITDKKLSKIIKTEAFPETLINMTLPTFESWWLANSYEWIKAKSENLQNQAVEDTQESNINKNNASTTKTNPLSTPTVQTQPVIKKPTVISNNPTQTNASQTNTPTQQARPIEKSVTSVNKQESTTAQNLSQPNTSTSATQTPQKQQVQKPATTTNKTVKKEPTGDVFDDLLSEWDSW